MFTKSGIMVGLGEERNEILQVMDDLRAANVDFLTIGQYLQPTRKHHPVVRFVPPDEFKAYETIAYAKGFLMVSSSPLTRSSHHAGDDFARLKAARDARRALTHAAVHTSTGCGTPPATCSTWSPMWSAIRNSCRCAASSGSASEFPSRKVLKILVADMTVAYKFVHETFTSRVTLDRPNLQILVEYLEGPFSRLENRWTFHPTRGADVRRGVLHLL